MQWNGAIQDVKPVLKRVNHGLVELMDLSADVACFHWRKEICIPEHGGQAEVEHSSIDFAVNGLAESLTDQVALMLLLAE